MIHPTLARLRARRAAEDRGFTLIELLVVVVIIGILVGIAVPLYLNYTHGAQDKSAESDVRGAISAVEQYYTNANNTYPASATSQTAPFTLAAAAGGTTPSDAPKVSVTSGNTLSIVVGSGSYKICGTHGSNRSVYLYDSSTGGSVKDAGTALSLTTCS